MSEQKPKYPKSPGYIVRRLKLGLRRTARQWNPVRKYHFRKSIRHRKRVFQSTPDIINILLIGLFGVFALLQLYDDTIYTSNPLFLWLFLILAILLFILNIWYAGCEDYLKYE